MRKTEDRIIELIKNEESLSTCIKRTNGVVIVKDNCVIGKGYNHDLIDAHTCFDNGCNRQNAKRGQEYENCPAIHAEQHAIGVAAKYGNSLKDSTMYISTMPCPNCAKLIVAAGIKEVVYFDDYEIEITKKIFDANGVVLRRG